MQLAEQSDDEELPEFDIGMTSSNLDHEKDYDSDDSIVVIPDEESAVTTKPSNAECGDEAPAPNLFEHLASLKKPSSAPTSPSLTSNSGNIFNSLSRSKLTEGLATTISDAVKKLAPISPATTSVSSPTLTNVDGHTLILAKTTADYPMGSKDSDHVPTNEILPMVASVPHIPNPTHESTTESEILVKTLFNDSHVVVARKTNLLDLTEDDIKNISDQNTRTWMECAIFAVEKMKCVAMEINKKADFDLKAYIEMKIPPNLQYFDPLNSEDLIKALSSGLLTDTLNNLGDYKLSIEKTIPKGVRTEKYNYLIPHKVAKLKDTLQAVTLTKMKMEKQADLWNQGRYKTIGVQPVPLQTRKLSRNDKRRRYASPDQLERKNKLRSGSQPLRIPPVNAWTSSNGAKKIVCKTKEATAAKPKAKETVLFSDEDLLKVPSAKQCKTGPSTVVPSKAKKVQENSCRVPEVPSLPSPIVDDTALPTHNESMNLPAPESIPLTNCGTKERANGENAKKDTESEEEIMPQLEDPEPAPADLPSVDLPSTDQPNKTPTDSSVSITKQISNDVMEVTPSTIPKRKQKPIEPGIIYIKPEPGTDQEPVPVNVAEPVQPTKKCAKSNCDNQTTMDKELCPVHHQKQQLLEMAHLIRNSSGSTAERPVKDTSTLPTPTASAPLPSETSQPPQTNVSTLPISSSSQPLVRVPNPVSSNENIPVIVTHHIPPMAPHQPLQQLGSNPGSAVPAQFLPSGRQAPSLTEPGASQLNQAIACGCTSAPMAQQVQSVGDFSFHKSITLASIDRRELDRIKECRQAIMNRFTIFDLLDSVQTPFQSDVQLYITTVCLFDKMNAIKKSREPITKDLHEKINEAYKKPFHNRQLNIYHLLTLLFNLIFTSEFESLPQLLCYIDFITDSQKHDYIRVMSLVEVCLDQLQNDILISCRYHIAASFRSLIVFENILDKRLSNLSVDDISNKIMQIEEQNFVIKQKIPAAFKFPELADLQKYGVTGEFFMLRRFIARQRDSRPPEQFTREFVRSVVINKMARKGSIGVNSGMSTSVAGQAAPLSHPAPPHPTPLSDQPPSDPATAHRMLTTQINAQNTTRAEMESIQVQLSRLPPGHGQTVMLQSRLSELRQIYAHQSQKIFRLKAVVISRREATAAQQQPPVSNSVVVSNVAAPGLRHLVWDPQRKQAFQQLIKDNAPRISTNQQAPSHQPPTEQPPSWTSQAMPVPPATYKPHPQQCGYPATRQPLHQQLAAQQPPLQQPHPSVQHPHRPRSFPPPQTSLQQPRAPQQQPTSRAQQQHIQQHHIPQQSLPRAQQQPVPRAQQQHCPQPQPVSQQHCPQQQPVPQQPIPRAQQKQQPLQQLAVGQQIFLQYMPPAQIQAQRQGILVPLSNQAAQHNTPISSQQLVAFPAATSQFTPSTAPPLTTADPSLYTAADSSRTVPTKRRRSTKKSSTDTQTENTDSVTQTTPNNPVTAEQAPVPDTSELRFYKIQEPGKEPRVEKMTAEQAGALQAKLLEEYNRKKAEAESIKKAVPTQTVIRNTVPIVIDLDPEDEQESQRTIPSSSHLTEAPASGNTEKDGIKPPSAPSSKDASSPSVPTTPTPPSPGNHNNVSGVTSDNHVTSTTRSPSINTTVTENQEYLLLEADLLSLQHKPLAEIIDMVHQLCKLETTNDSLVKETADLKRKVEEDYARVTAKADQIKKRRHELLSLFTEMENRVEPDIEIINNTEVQIPSTESLKINRGRLGQLSDTVKNITAKKK